MKGRRVSRPLLEPYYNQAGQGIFYLHIISIQNISDHNSFHVHHSLDKSEHQEASKTEADGNESGCEEDEDIRGATEKEEVVDGNVDEIF